jgi:2-keto-4-pentenoate hydratase
MLEERARLLAQGEGTVGWKLGFGAPTWLEKFGLAGPLVGFLPTSRVTTSGAHVSCEGWVNPVAEPEIALYLGIDVDDPDLAGEAIAAVGPAIELADVDTPPEDIGEVLAGNIFHRGVVLGAPRPFEGSVAGMRARITKSGSVVADTQELEALTGGIASILGHVAGLLLAVGERLRVGDVVIAGSVVPPIPVQPGDHVTFELAPLPPISVRV